MLKILLLLLLLPLSSYSLPKCEGTNPKISVAKTVAHDFESGWVSEEKAEFSLVAEEGFEPPTFGL